MSLKGFHILFIVLAILATAGFAAWTMLASKEVVTELLHWAGIVSAVISAALVVYGFWFLKKSRGIIT